MCLMTLTASFGNGNCSYFLALIQIHQMTYIYNCLRANLYESCYRSSATGFKMHVESNIHSPSLATLPAQKTLRSPYSSYSSSGNDGEQSGAAWDNCEELGVRTHEQANHFHVWTFVTCHGA